MSGGGGDGVGTLPTFKEESQALWLNVQPCPNKHNDTGLLHGSPDTPTVAHSHHDMDVLGMAVSRHEATGSSSTRQLQAVVVALPHGF